MRACYTTCMRFLLSPLFFLALLVAYGLGASYYKTLILNDVVIIEDTPLYEDINENEAL